MAGVGIEMHVHRPDPRIAGLVLAAYGYAEVTPGPMRRREVPGTAIVMIIELGPAITVTDGVGPARHPMGFVCGLALAPVLTETVGRQAGVQVMFSALGAGRLLGLPIGALGGGMVGIDILLGAEGRALAMRLRDAAGWAARFAILDAWLLSRAAAMREVPADLAAAAGALARAGGALPIGVLARRLGCGERLLERRFAAEFGLSPKRFARLARFERAVARLAAGLTPAEVAAAGGFADQAHLTHEVRALAGLPPAALQRRRLPGEHGLAE
jgi:AraC-like DNA-binding protein